MILVTILSLILFVFFTLIIRLVIKHVYWFDTIRITKKTTLGGDVFYQIQKRFLFFFWLNGINLNDGLNHDKLISTVINSQLLYASKHKLKKKIRKESKFIKSEPLKEFQIYKKELLIEKYNGN